MKRLKSFLSNIAFILSILGIVTFSLFILEEAVQVTIFGTWPAQNAKDWDLVLEGCDTIDSINQTIKILNCSIGWIQPFAFVSYRAYSKATDYYVQALRKKVLANAPECFEGKKVEFLFTPKRIILDGNQVRLINCRIVVITDKIPEARKLLVSGILQKQGNLLVIKTDSIRPAH